MKDARRKLYQPQKHDLVYEEEGDNYFEDDSMDDNYEDCKEMGIDIHNGVIKSCDRPIKSIHKISSIDCMAAMKIKSHSSPTPTCNSAESLLDDHPDRFLSLCVPLPQLEMVSFKERPSKRQAAWSAMSIFGVLSLPIVGYYLLNLLM